MHTNKRLTHFRSSFFFAENLSQIQVTGIDDLFEGKKMIANLLFWVAKLTISQDLSLSENNPEIFKYLQQIATLKEQYLANKL